MLPSRNPFTAAAILDVTVVIRLVWFKCLPTVVYTESVYDYADVFKPLQLCGAFLKASGQTARAGNRDVKAPSELHLALALSLITSFTFAHFFPPWYFFFSFYTVFCSAV